MGFNTWKLLAVLVVLLATVAVEHLSYAVPVAAAAAAAADAWTPEKKREWLGLVVHEWLKPGV